MLAGLFAALGIFTAGFVWMWASAMRRAKLTELSWGRKLLDAGIGFLTNFLDTLGIGSFATTTTLFRLGKLVPDEQIPGTLNVGHTLPSILEAFIFIAVVQVDITTLILMVAASIVGAWLGAGIVAKWPRRYIQVGMGLALLA